MTYFLVLGIHPFFRLMASGSNVYSNFTILNLAQILIKKDEVMRESRSNPHSWIHWQQHWVLQVSDRKASYFHLQKSTMLWNNHGNYRGDPRFRSKKLPSVVIFCWGKMTRKYAFTVGPHSVCWTHTAFLSFPGPVGTLSAHLVQSFSPRQLVS